MAKRSKSDPTLKKGKNLKLKTNNKKSQKLIGMKLYTGRVTVTRINGKYLFSKFSAVTRLTASDAIMDAKHILD